MLYGLRYANHEYEIGEEIEHMSHVWDDGTMTDEVLPGISTIAIADEYDAETRELGLLQPVDDEWYCGVDSDVIVNIAKSYNYGYKHAYVVAGDAAGDGEDVGEIILKNAVVIAMLW